MVVIEQDGIALNSKNIYNLKGFIEMTIHTIFIHSLDQSWVFIGRTDVEAETPVLWPPDAKS